MAELYRNKVESHPDTSVFPTAACCTVNLILYTSLVVPFQFAISYFVEGSAQRPRRKRFPESRDSGDCSLCYLNQKLRHIHTIFGQHTAEKQCTFKGPNHPRIHLYSDLVVVVVAHWYITLGSQVLWDSQLWDTVSRMRLMSELQQSSTGFVKKKICSIKVFPVQRRRQEPSQV